MKRMIVGAIGAAVAFGLVAGRAEAQTIRGSIAIATPYVAGRVVFGPEPYRGRVYDPYDRRWLAPWEIAALQSRYERARYLEWREYQRHLRAVERAYRKDRRQAEREYRRWLRKRARGRGHGRGPHR